MDRQSVYSLANIVAHELSDAHRAYSGEKWEMMNGREKAIPFEVMSPSLAGVTLADVSDTAPDFSFLVYDARTSSGEDRVTYLFHCDLELSKDGLSYTGRVVIREKNFDWQR